MPITIDADIPPIERLRTGLWGLDWALADGGELGIPLRGIYELYGKPGIGKSSLGYYLAGRRATKELNKVVLCDLESTADVPFVVSNLQAAGFDGKLYVIRAKDEKKKKNEGMRPHEDMLREAIDSLTEKDVAAVVLDSIGSIATIPEMEADFGEAQIGSRAKVMAAASRRLVAWLRNVAEPKLFLAINHVQVPIGGRGHVTPGGDTIKYLAEARVMMYRNEGFDDGSFVTEFKVERLKHGGTNQERNGYLFIIPGMGLSPQMTAVLDCVELGLAERGNTLTLDLHGKEIKFGYLSKVIEMAKDPEQHKKFEPFFEALAAWEQKGEW